MARVTHSHNDGAPRARLISTPGRLDMSQTSTVVGIKFSDQTAALLDHALAEGWRVEPDSRSATRGKPNTVIVYPVDKTQQPVTVAERGARFNKAHYENLRRQMYHAGLPPLPSDTTGPSGSGILTANSQAEAEARLPDGAKAVNLHELLQDLAAMRESEFVTAVEDPAIAPGVLAALIHGILVRLGVSYDVATDTGVAVRHACMVALATRVDVDEIVGAVTTRLQTEVNDALAMASDADARANRLEGEVHKMDAKERAARADCAAALADARAQKARADELEAALAPLRTLLGKV